MLLQSVIEAVSGLSLNAYMGQYVFKSAGMHDSSFVWREAYSKRAVPGSAGLWSRPVRLLSPVAAASLYTTASDFARFLTTLLRNEPLIALTGGEICGCRQQTRSFMGVRLGP
ncbi:MAG: serine hydrolase [Candidatus Competibacteraceae bacterium]|nr:serine hydrolase [Candidatus Competibacteraceae bacterium]